PAKLYKLKHLSKVEVLTNDPSGCTFTLGFDNLRSQSVAPPQWSMRNIDDRNRLLLCILTICKDVLGRLPKVVGIDVVEMALWAKIETRNNSLQMQSVNNKSLIEELDKLLERLRVPSEYATCLTGGSFDEDRMLQNVEACEWLTSALRGLEVPNIDPTYASMKAVKEKRAELEKLKSTFVRRASEFLRNYFASLVDFMISDKSYFSQRGQLKRPDHADLRYKCRTYARLLQHLKSLDKNCLGPLRKAYCSSLNLLLRRESSFFAHFMCFEVPTLVPPGGIVNGNKAGYDDDDDLGIMDIDENDGKNSDELAALNESLQDLLDGIQEDFYAVVDWAYKIDPLRCISMHGITERYLSGQKADAAGFVRLLLGDLESRISMQFSRFVDEACHQIERNERNVRQMGVLSYIPRFATLATRMEQYIQGQSRDLVDQAYTKFVSVMLQPWKKYHKHIRSMQTFFFLRTMPPFRIGKCFLHPPANRLFHLYDLANIVPTLAKFYHQASEAYEQACTRHISMIIYFQFERLFQFARRIEDLMFTVAPEEIPFQLGLSKMDLRKMLKSSLSGKEFLDKYESFAQLVAKIYPNETILSVAEIKEQLANM
ncbi:hypothetical protein TSUD_04200, partial [Trifolium subterraneum]